jgi:hypothetical protein
MKVGRGLLFAGLALGAFLGAQLPPMARGVLPAGHITYYSQAAAGGWGSIPEAAVGNHKTGGIEG